MPALTSVKSGRWSDPTTWNLGVVPANGDTVTIAAGHEVIFNVDQSNFNPGLAGLTINGTLRIPSRAVDPSMPTTVVLRVNANIAGSGSLIIGSASSPITAPQVVRISINGSITVAVFEAYGEERNPTFDYLASNAGAGSTTIVLRDGMPLRPGDRIAIGVTSPAGSDFEFTVQSYNQETKTATISPALPSARSGTEPTSALVLLLTRSIKITKFGSSTATWVTGSGRVLRGVEFQLESGAPLNTTAVSVSSSILVNCTMTQAGGSSIGFGVSNSLVENCVGYFVSWLVGDDGSSTIRNVAHVRSNYSLLVWRCRNVTNAHCHNVAFCNPANEGDYFEATNVVVKRDSLVRSGLRPFRYATVRVSNFTVVNGGFGVAWGAEGGLVGELRNGQIYIDSNATIYSPIGCCGRFVIEDVTVNTIGSAVVTYYLSSPGQTYRNFRITRGVIVNNSDNVVFNNLTMDSPTGAIISNSLGRCFINNLVLNASYVRPTFFRPPFGTAYMPFLFVDINRATINGVLYERFRERIFPYGYIRNRWDSSPPDYDTFEFVLTDTSIENRPLYLDYRVKGSQAITISGTLQQLPSGDRFVIQIFRVDCEPLLGNSPDFQRVFTQAGAIEISWTPPSDTDYIVRVQAEMNQTSFPVVISGLTVGAGGSRNTYQFNLQEAVGATFSENISNNLRCSNQENNQISATESTTNQMGYSTQINAQVSVSGSSAVDLVVDARGQITQVATTEQIQSRFSASVNETGNITAIEQNTTDIAVNSTVSEALKLTETSFPTLVVAANEPANLSFSEAQKMSFSAQESSNIETVEEPSFVLSVRQTDSVNALTDERISSHVAFSAFEPTTLQLAEVGTQWIEVVVSERTAVDVSGSLAITLPISVSEGTEIALTEQANQIQPIRVSSPVTVRAHRKIAVSIRQVR